MGEDDERGPPNIWTRPNVCGDQFYIEGEIRGRGFDKAVRLLDGLYTGAGLGNEIDRLIIQKDGYRAVIEGLGLKNLEELEAYRALGSLEEIEARLKELDEIKKKLQ